MSLVNDTIETVRRLTAIVGEETLAIEGRAALAELKLLAAEKALLADRIEQLGEAMKRAGRDALLAEPPALRAALAGAVDGMNTALAANGRLIARRKALSEALLGAVLDEAKRQAGTELAAYGGAAPRRERAAAIAYNAEA